MLSIWHDEFLDDSSKLLFQQYAGQRPSSPLRPHPERMPGKTPTPPYTHTHTSYTHTSYTHTSYTHTSYTHTLYTHTPHTHTPHTLTHTDPHTHRPSSPLRPHPGRMPDKNPTPRKYTHIVHIHRDPVAPYSCTRHTCQVYNNAHTRAQTPPTYTYTDTSYIHAHRPTETYVLTMYDPQHACTHTCTLTHIQLYVQKKQCD